MRIGHRGALLALAGVAIGASPAVGQFSTWIATEEVRIGAMDGPDAFSDIQDMTVDPRGQMYVAERIAGQVVVYSPNGRRLAAIGGIGSGPGEFRGLATGDWIDGHLVTSDFILRRATRFSEDGRWVETVSLPTFGGAPIRTARALRSGLVGTPEPSVNDLTADRFQEAPLVFIAGDSVAAVIGNLSRRNAIVQARLGPEAIVTGPHPFPESTLWAPTGAGDAVILVERRRPTRNATPRFRVLKLRVNGDTVFDRTYQYQPKPLELAKVDAVILEILERVPRGDVALGSSANRILRTALDAPEHLPPITQLVVGSDGTIWLRREDMGGPLVRWHVLDELGKLSARIDLPRTLEVQRANASHVWGTIPGDYGIPVVVRYRVRAAAQ